MASWLTAAAILLRCKRIMSVSVRFVIVAVLLATAGCRPSYVVVTARVPAELNPSAIRVVRESQGRRLWKQDDRLSPPRAGQPYVEYPIGIPSSAIGFTLVVQAMSAERLLAEARLDVTGQEIGTVLILQPCKQDLRRREDFEPCGPVAPAATPAAPTDAGPEVSAEAGASDTTVPGDGPPPDTGSDVCLQADPAAPQPPAPPVSMVSSACQRYCGSMQQSCPSVYGTPARCWYACDLLGWPAMGDRGQDTVACRTIHAEEPAPTPFERAQLCEAASPVITRACGDICAVYCRSGVRICPNTFPSETECRSGCEADRERWKQIVMQNPDAGGSHDYFSKLRCRMDNLEIAIFNRTYCSVAAPNVMCGVCPYLPFNP